MIRTLLIITGAALVLAVVTLGGAAALGGRDMARHGWAWTFKDDDGSSVSVHRADDRRIEQTSKTLTWTGGDSLIVEMAADVEYVQGATPGVVVTGAADLVDRIRLEGNRLTMVNDGGPNNERIVFGRNADGRGIWVDSEQVRVVVTAPAIHTFDLRGSSDVTLTNYDQDTLTVSQSGSGDIEATGRVRALKLTITGSGDADLNNLATVDAEVDLSGSGDAYVAPTGAATVSSSGSGDIELATRPTTLRQTSTGSGDIRQN